MAIIREDNISGTLDASGLPLNSPTMNSPGLADLPAVAGGDIAYVMVNPFGANAVGPELAVVTAHAAGSTTATVLRGVNPLFPQQDHPAGTIWVHGPVKEDLDNFQAQIDAFFTAAILTTAGDHPVATAPGVVARQPAPGPWKVDRGDSAQPTRVSASYGLTIVCTRATRPTQDLYTGMKIIETDTYHELMWTGAAWRYQDDAPGTIKLSADGNLLPGFVWANGAQLDGAVNPNQDLFAHIGTNYGAGDSVGAHFNVPDYRQTMPIGYILGGSDPGRVTGATSIGHRGGQSSVIIATTQIPSHSHSATVGTSAPSFSGTTDSGGGHVHTYGGAAVQTDQGDPFLHVPYRTFGDTATQGLVTHSPAAGNANISFSAMDSAGSHTHPVSGSVASHAHSATIGSTGGGLPLTVQNPFLTCAFMVRL